MTGAVNGSATANKTQQAWCQDKKKHTRDCQRLCGPLSVLFRLPLLTSLPGDSIKTTFQLTEIVTASLLHSIFAVPGYRPRYFTCLPVPQYLSPQFLAVISH